MAVSAADKVVHGNDLTYITQQYKNYFQAKESGKGLSTNDYTTAEKTKLSNIASGAQANVIETVKVNGTALTVDANKAVDVTVPTTASEIGAAPAGGSGTTDFRVRLLVDDNGNSHAFTTSSAVALADADHIIPDDAAVVHKTGTETIGGFKVFTNGIVLNGEYHFGFGIVNPGAFEFADMLNDFYQPVRAASFIKTGGTSTQFLKADGSVDSTAYATKASAALTGTPTAPTASAGTNTTQIATTAFVTTAVSNALASITGISFNTDYSTYAALSAATGTTGVIYLIPNSGSSPNSYDEYFWNGSGYEKFGTTDVDLSGYVQTSALESLTTSEITTLLNL